MNPDKFSSLKLRLAAGTALAVVIFTLVVGLLHATRPMVIVYRTLISGIIFFIFGYGIGLMIEKKVERLLPEADEEDGKGKKIDIVSVNEQSATELLSDQNDGKQSELENEQH